MFQSEILVFDDEVSENSFSEMIVCISNLEMQYNGSEAIENPFFAV